MKYVILIIIIIIILVIFIGRYIENKLIFVPDKLPVDYDFNLPFHEQKLKKINKAITLTEHKLKYKNGFISAVYLNNPNAKSTILHSHGNAGSIDGRMELFYKFGKYASMIIYDYTGFGKSPGTPTEKDAYENAHTVWKYLVNKKNVDPNSIIIHGTSLGSSVSAWLCQKLCKIGKKPKGLIMQSGFCCLKHMIESMFPTSIATLGNMVRKNKFTSYKYLKNIDNDLDVVILHSQDDEVINYSQKNNLLKHAESPKIKFIEIGGLHSSPIHTKESFKCIEVMCKA